MVNEILLRRKNRIMVEQGTASKTEYRYVATLLEEIQTLGYTFSKEMVDILFTFSQEEWKTFSVELMPILKSLRGADVTYHPMYVNFPEEVMQETEAKLYMNAFVHYLSYGRLYPVQVLKERAPLFDEKKLQVLEAGTKEDLMQIFVQLVSAGTSVSTQDKEDIRWFFENTADIQKYLPESIPLKENAALIGKLYIECYPLADAKELHPYFKTATDVLRLAAAMSDGDISLTENTRFRSFHRRERRILLTLLEQCGDLEEDMIRNRERFIRLGERLHPGEYAGRYEKTADTFAALRNGEKIRTYGGKLAYAIEQGNFSYALSLLKQRPGEFARRLDHIARIHPQPEKVAEAFDEVAVKVSVPVLLHAREHFLHRNDGEIRSYMPKGRLAKITVIDTPLPALGKVLCDRLVDICTSALVEKFREKEAMGKVYLAETMKHYIVPFSQRNASKTVKTMVRGSRMPVDAGAKAVRGFIWWTNTEKGGRVDIDLSAAIFDENFRYLEHVSYTNLRSKKYAACHSGDITNGGPAAGKGVSEFLDVDIDAVARFGGRYVVYQIYSYTGQSFASLPNVRFGFMEREDVASGEIFEPSTVKQKMDVMAESRVCIPVIFDCVTRVMIWCDMNLSLASCRWGGNNVESNLNGVSLACYSMVHMHKPSIYDLVSLHVMARGILCDSKEEADIIFDEEDGITPYDTEVFMSEYLT